MKKTVRNVLIMLAVLAVLGGGLALLLLFPSETEENPSSAPSSEVSAVEQTVVTDREAEEVASVSVKNQAGSFALVPNGEGFTVEGYEDFDLNLSAVSSSVNSLLALSSTKDLGSLEDLEDFGLSGEAAVSVEISYQDGGKDQLTLGNAAGESSGRYLLKDGKGYIVSGLSTQLYGSVYGYFNTTLYTIADRTEGVENDDGTTTVQAASDILQSLKLSGANFPQPIEIKYEPGYLVSYIMTAPVSADSGNEALDEVIAALKAPEATSVAAAKLTPELLEQYGLAEPAAKAEFELNNEKHTVSVSKPNGEGACYLLLDDRDVIYTVAEDTVSAWADAGVMKLRLSYIGLFNIMEVENLSVTAEGDMAYSFDVTRTVNEEKTTEERTSYDLAVKNAGGKDVDYESYQSFYKALLSIAVLNCDRPEYGGQPAYQVKYRYFENGGEETVEFYAAGEDRYAAVLNGEFNGQIRKSDLDKVMSELSELNESTGG